MWEESAKVTFTQEQVHNICALDKRQVFFFQPTRSVYMVWQGYVFILHFPFMEASAIYHTTESKQTLQPEGFY